MSQLALAETSEFYRVDASLKLDPKQRSLLGQYMTPAPIARFMASLFSEVSGDLCVLDPGAGVGSLTAALIERLCADPGKLRSAQLVCYEIEPLLLGYLQDTLKQAQTQAPLAHTGIRTRIHEEDFILSRPPGSDPDFFEDDQSCDGDFTHVIMNPPYKKINSASTHRQALRKAGLETSNLYTGFMFLAALKLREGGEFVAIVPRSFCNGPYFKPFRQQFFSTLSLRHIHIFEKRNAAFKEDQVLQENIILHAIKGPRPSHVTITTSRGGDFELVDGQFVAEDMTEREVPYDSILRPEDPDSFVHIATNELEQAIVDRMATFTTTLTELGLEVSTGPVVDFRLKDDLRAQPEDGAVPLLYPAHFQGRALQWPKTMRKPNAIHVSESSRKWLWKNKGHFVVTKRFTSKEERRRVVASVYSSELPGDLIGFENHLNLYHSGQRGVSAALARGVALYLNSSLVDRFFRQFNGHTQVNATDLRSLRYPSREALERLGDHSGAPHQLSQQEIDNLLEEEIPAMPNDINPLQAQQKIDEALIILQALGMPRGQQNERSALTLLALIDLKPSGDWATLKKPLMGITPIMDYSRIHYGRVYAPNTRENFRRQTMHQFVEAGIALYNPDKPDRPVNSPKACYQVSEEAYQVIRTFGTDVWQPTLDTYLEGQPTLAAKWAKHREMQMIPVTITDGHEISLTPGDHSILIKQIITEFAPRYAPGAEVIYVGDTGDKIGFFNQERLAELGVTVDRHGKMPDVVLYYAVKNWLLLIESVTSHGPVDAKRHNELAALFSTAGPGLVYVTAFPNRGIMARYLGEISWETEVWCADSPTHLIHFDGERFLGPYEGS